MKTEKQYDFEPYCESLLNDLSLPLLKQQKYCLFTVTFQLAVTSSAASKELE